MDSANRYNNFNETGLRHASTKRSLAVLGLLPAGGNRRSCEEFFKVIIVGNLGHDSEIRYMPSGDAIANIAVATSFKSMEERFD